ncbi:hypothetical protein HB774_32320 (plasmid) [Rhizobium leguminosarum bv. viciae]|nr:hypothetical protein HB774_32320 [Rhizobium leguminosarum bv. viciae]
MRDLCRSHSVAAWSLVLRAGRQATRDGLRVYAVGRGRRAQGLSDESGEKPIRADAFETADVARIEVFPTDRATGGGSMVKFPEQ